MTVISEGVFSPYIILVALPSKDKQWLAGKII